MLTFFDRVIDSYLGANKVFSKKIVVGLFFTFVFICLSHELEDVIAMSKCLSKHNIKFFYIKCNEN